MAATTVKKPSENSPLKRANRRHCERKQKPRNRVRATKGRNWEKTVENTRLIGKQNNFNSKKTKYINGSLPSVATWQLKCKISSFDRYEL